MRAVVIVALVIFFTASLATAQTGPKQKEKPKKKKAPVEKVEEKTDASKPESPPQAKPAEAKTPPVPTEPEVQRSDAPSKTGPLRRAVFTTAIQAREPVDRVDSLSADARQVYFFTELFGLQGQTVTHRWIYDEGVKSEVPIRVGASRWRAYSSKKLLPGWAGVWTVEVVDSSGTVLGSGRFIYH